MANHLYQNDLPGRARPRPVWWAIDCRDHWAFQSAPRQALRRAAFVGRWACASGAGRQGPDRGAEPDGDAREPGECYKLFHYGPVRTSTVLLACLRRDDGAGLLHQKIASKLVRNLHRPPRAAGAGCRTCSASTSPSTSSRATGGAPRTLTEAQLDYAASGRALSACAEGAAVRDARPARVGR